MWLQFSLSLVCITQPALICFTLAQESEQVRAPAEPKASEQQDRDGLA